MGDRASKQALFTEFAAVGKVRTLAQRGEPMPEGWMVGRDGKPLTDPNRREEGLLLPIGGPKGYGLALAIGLLAGVLNGAAFGRAVVDFTKQPGTATNTGQFVAAIAVDAFGDPDAFSAAVDLAFDEMRAAAPLPGYEPVRIESSEGRSEYARRQAEFAERARPLRDRLVFVCQSILTVTSLR